MTFHAGGDLTAGQPSSNVAFHKATPSHDSQLPVATHPASTGLMNPHHTINARKEKKIHQIAHMNVARIGPPM
jgi:hypothetical protein